MINEHNKNCLKNMWLDLHTQSEPHWTHELQTEKETEAFKTFPFLLLHFTTLSHLWDSDSN